MPLNKWSTLAHLAFGVTTVHDPSNNATEIFTASEYQRTGEILAPRIFSTGDVCTALRSESSPASQAPKTHAITSSGSRRRVPISIKNYNQRAAISARW